MAEIDTLKTLKHPNVVRLQNHGHDDKLLWLAMDWIDGQSLSQVAAKLRGEGKDVPIEDIKTTILQVVAGLEYLHGKQIVHRDLKPSNVLIAQDGLVKLVDFGIARSAATGQTALTTQLLTPAWSPAPKAICPRAIRGPADRIGQRYLFAGRDVVRNGHRPPSHGGVHGAESDPKRLPAKLESIIAQCLQVSPLARPSLETINRALQMSAAQPTADDGRTTGWLCASRTGRVASALGAVYRRRVAAARRAIRPADGRATPPQRPATHQGPTNPAAPGNPTLQLDQPGQWNQGQMNPSGQPAAHPPSRAADQVMQAAAQAAKATSSAVHTFLHEHPPAHWLDRIGPAGRWIKQHKGPSIAIGAARFPDSPDAADPSLLQQFKPHEHRRQRYANQHRRPQFSCQEYTGKSPDQYTDRRRQRPSRRDAGHARPARSAAATYGAHLGGSASSPRIHAAGHLAQRSQSRSGRRTLHRRRQSRQHRCDDVSGEYLRHAAIRHVRSEQGDHVGPQSRSRRRPTRRQRPDTNGPAAVIRGQAEARIAKGSAWMLERGGVSFVQAGNQAADHLGDHFYPLSQIETGRFGHKVLAKCEFHKRHALLSRRAGDDEEILPVGLCESAVAFGQIRRDGECGASSIDRSRSNSRGGKDSVSVAICSAKSMAF